MAKSQVRPPYAADGAIRTLLDSIKTKGDPGTLDAKWLASYGLGGAQPHAVIGTLKWLGVIDGENKTVPGVWNKLRTTQQATLSELVRSAYAPIFKAIDVEQAERADIEGAFIHEYGSGDTGRVTKAFMTLCALGGIDSPAIRAISEGGQKSAGNTPTTKKAAAKKAAAPKPASTASDGQRSESGATKVQRRVTKDEMTSTTLTRVSFNVEIPADWDETQVHQRVVDVLRAVRDAEDS